MLLSDKLAPLLQSDLSSQNDGNFSRITRGYLFEVKDKKYKRIALAAKMKRTLLDFFAPSSVVCKQSKYYLATYLIK